MSHRQAAAAFNEEINANQGRVEVPTLDDNGNLSDEGFVLANNLSVSSLNDASSSGDAEDSRILAESVADDAAVQILISAANAEAAEGGNTAASLLQLARDRRAHIDQVLTGVNEHLTLLPDMARLRALSAAFFADVESITGVDLMAAGDHGTLPDRVFAMHLHSATVERVNPEVLNHVTQQTLELILNRIHRFYGRIIIQTMFNDHLPNGDNEFM